MTLVPQPPYAETVSEAARAALTPLLNAPPPPEMAVEQMREMAAQMQTLMAATRPEHGAVSVVPGEMGGVPVLRITATGADTTTPSRLLLNFHGGGFAVDSGSLTETVPLATRVEDAAIVAAKYRLAPEHAFPAAVEDALAVYREALRTWAPERIAVFGTSAGAVLTLQLLARLKAEGLPMPAAAGLFSGAAELSVVYDCEAFLPPLLPGKALKEVVADYVGAADPRDPLLSPLHGDLTGLPPTLLMASTRDQMLSSTVVAHRALLRAGVQAELQVFEGLPHAFWAWVPCPEADEAFDAMAAFFERRLTR